MLKSPLVSVVCLCFEQADFVTAALDSVLAQDYPNLELIVVDDGSADGSRAVIRAYAEQANMPIQLVFPPKNLGNCKAFNLGLRQAKGKYVIDLAGDDVMASDRVSKQVAAFEQLPERYAVVFSDAYLCDAQLNVLHRYYERVSMPPSGDVYQHILGLNCICPPTMMMRKKVLDELGGYNEALSYEDFDFWVRSARHYHYYGLSDVLTYKRQLPHSHGNTFYRKRQNRHLISTLSVCHFAEQQNETEAEHAALAATAHYYLKISALTEQAGVARGFYRLLGRLGHRRWRDHLWHGLAAIRLPLFPAYQLLRRLRA